LPVPGRFPTNRIAECREIDGGDDETILAREVAVDRFRELRSRREVDEPIGHVDRGAMKSAGVECRPFIGGQHLVGDLIGTDCRRAARGPRNNIERAGFAKVVEVRLGRALETLPQLAAEGLGPFNFIFLDADKRTYPEYLEWCIKLSRRGTMIVADNVVRDGAVVDSASRDADVRGVRRFLERLSTDPRVNATAIQTVGSKGYDGIALAVITEEP
jgi:O-methyltransferase